MDKIKEQIIDSCITEICKDENKEKLTKSLIDPIMTHVMNKFQYILIIIAVFMIILYSKVTYILFLAIRNPSLNS